MNYGKCKHCWWWKEYYPYFGKCYMHNSNEGRYTITREDSYCPDYINRKKEEKVSGATLKECLCDEEKEEMK